MAKTYRLGVIGFAHMHVNELMGQFAALPNVQWVACADTVPRVPETRETQNTRGWNRVCGFLQPSPAVRINVPLHAIHGMSFGKRRAKFRVSLCGRLSLA